MGSLYVQPLGRYTVEQEGPVPLLPPTRPLLIWAVLALACVVVLTVEGVVLLSGPTLQARGWRFGVHFLLGSLVALPWRRGCMTFMPS